jgi:hypothetical protein
MEGPGHTQRHLRQPLLTTHTHIRPPPIHKHTHIQAEEAEAEAPAAPVKVNGSCNCPDARMRGRSYACKHQIYVALRVLGLDAVRVLSVLFLSFSCAGLESSHACHSGRLTTQFIHPNTTTRRT